jgi:hypothetical protein
MDVPGMHGSGLSDAARPAGTAALGFLERRAVGPLRVDPPLHRVAGPDGEAVLEPKMMLVLLALAEAQGRVVPRQQLFDIGWAGTLVGDEALNRSIAGVRRALAAVGGGVSIETIPRTGYRLLLPPTPDVMGRPETRVVPAPPSAGVGRRQLLAGAAAALAVGLAGTWWARQPARAATAHVRAGQLLLDTDPESWADAGTRADRALKLAPDLADAWGLKARVLVEKLSMKPPEEDPVVIRAALEDAAGRALALDPTQADARAALAAAEPFHGAWFACDRRVAAVLADAPQQRQALLYRAELLVDCGRIADADRLLVPLSGGDAPMQRAVSVRAILKARQGDASEAYRLAAEAGSRWPGHPDTARTRVTIEMHLGRWEEAATALQGFGTSFGDGRLFPPGVAPLLHAAMKALAAGDVARMATVARQVEPVAVSRISATNYLMPVLAALGAVDSAFRVADALYFDRGPLRLPLTSPNGGSVLFHRQLRRTRSLFWPMAAAMRADDRFWPLVRSVGLVAAWRAWGVKPDFLAEWPLPA